MSRARPGGAAVRAQTRAYAAHVGVLAAQLRREIWVPERPGGARGLVVLMGTPGVGKSHCARLLAARLGAAQVASDELRSRLFIAPSYAAKENATIFACVDALVDDLLGDGHRVIVDATNLLARYRGSSVGAALRHNAPVVYVLVTAEEPEILARLAARRTARAADDHSDADERVYERMRDRAFEPPDEPYLELRNGSDLATEIERVAVAVERACDRAI